VPPPSPATILMIIEIGIFGQISGRSWLAAAKVIPPLNYSNILMAFHSPGLYQWLNPNAKETEGGH